MFFGMGISLSAQTIKQDTLSNNSKTVDPKDAVFNAQPDNNPFNFSTLNPNSVNTYTGRADITIPLYNINFGGMDFPINLMYNSEGIQVDQYANEVGLGWSISSIGEIVKEVNGSYEDNELRDNNYSYLNGNQASPSGDFPDYYNINAPTLFGRFFIDKDLKARELEGIHTADISFTRSKTAESEILKFGTVSNRKVIGPCGPHPHGLFVAYFLYSFINSCQGTGNAWSYLDTQQIKIIKDRFTYNFGEFEHTRINTKTKDVTFRDSQTFPPEGVSTTEMDYHTGYKLTEIKDNTTKNTLQVSYIPLARYNEAAKLDKTWDKLIHRVDAGFVTSIFRKIKEFDVTTKEAYIKKLVSSIKTDEVEVLFNYDNAREDKITHNMILSEIPLAPDVEYVGPFWGAEQVNPLVKEPLLRSIVIKNNIGQIISQYTFIYDYFNSGCSDTELCKRLKLVAIMKGYGENNANKEIHKFSYYEDQNLPKITSFNKDVFGFKNNLTESSLKDTYGFPVRPFLYQYNELRENINFSYYSPLKVPGLNPGISAGTYDQGISGLENIRAWSLKSITYPTQGVQSFVYEPNEFIWKGIKIKGGGLRIKEIKMMDPVTTKTLSTRYTYGDGQVSSLPMVTSEQDLAGSDQGTRASIPQSFTTLVNRSKGGIVVYPESRQINPDEGYIDFKYSSYTDYPDQIKYKWLDGVFATDIMMDRYLFAKNSIGPRSYNPDYLRGNIISKKMNDKNGSLLKTSSYQYTSTEDNYPTLPEPITVNKARLFYYPVNNTYASNYPSPTAQYTSSTVKRNSLTSRKDTEYFSGNTINTETNFTYTDRYNVPKTVTTISPITTETLINNYAFEADIPGISDTPDYKQILLETDKKIGNEEVEKKKKNFVPFDAMMLPNSGLTFNFETNNWTQELLYDLYDNKGNVLQVTALNKPSVILWGYKQTRPLARIEGATYQEVMQAMGMDPGSNTSYLGLEMVKKSDLDVDMVSEKELISELIKFKDKPEFKNFQIITYAYDPLVGVKNMINPSGFQTNYIYDGSNRLQKVLDGDANLVSEYKYNYSVARYFNSEKSKVFTKDCGSSGVGSTHLYTVAENTYSSTNSQLEADSMAENDLNANGQNYANTVGTCNAMSCSIIKGNSSISNWQYGTISMYGGGSPNYRVKIQYNFQSGSWNTGVIVGKVTGTCVSSNVRTSSTFSSGLWGITVNPNGDIIARFMTGPTFNLPPDNTVIVLDFSLPTN